MAIVCWKCSCIPHMVPYYRQVWINKWIDNNESLTVGIFTTAVTEGSARLANCIVWTYHTLQNNSSNNDELKEGDIFPIVWMPQILCGTIVLIGCHCIECCIASCKRTHEVDLYYTYSSARMFDWIWPGILLVSSHYTDTGLSNTSHCYPYLHPGLSVCDNKQCCEQCCKQCFKQSYKSIKKPKVCKKKL